MNSEEKFEKFKKEKLKNFKSVGQVNFSGKQIDMPFKYSDASAVMAFFPISYKKANDMIGNDRLKPVSILRGRSVVGITIFEYRECPIGPYREIALSIPVMRDTKISIPFLPLIFDFLFKKFGFYTILLAMNTDIAKEHSKEIFGYPTYHKNIKLDIKEKKDYIFINAIEEEKNIISMKIKILKKFKILKKTYNTYFINKNNQIMNVKMDTIVSVARSSCKKDLILDIGNHKISNILKELSIEPYPLKNICYNKAVEFLSHPVKI